MKGCGAWAKCVTLTLGKKLKKEKDCKAEKVKAIGE